ncbi:MAG: imidazole glycerol phosphate synthase subunit HisH [Lachnospiraceae bacterium]|nr:imidazole glycerol phosphate synthase subunit HisH [Lachnospiraceae bacterium]
MIAIVDYDAGNIKSVEKALVYIGEEVVLTRDKDTILGADGVVLPGVGAFGEAMDRLNAYGLSDVLREVAKRNIPLLGICLGQQLLFDESEETPGVKGLGILKGKIKRIPDTGLKIPHIGWNNLQFPNKGRLFEGIPEDSYVYFVHSYYLESDDPKIVTASCEYGCTVQASVECGNIFATQFHPEKSSDTGLKILENFVGIVKNKQV